MNAGDTPIGRHPPVIVVGLRRQVSDAVLVEAAHVARDLGCEMVCACVDPGRYEVEQHEDGSVRSLPLDPDLPELEEGGFDAGVEAHIASVLDGSGVAWSSRALAGNPARALARLAAAVSARMIVVGTHTPGFRATVNEYFRASVAVQLAHRQHRPVLVVPLDPVDGDGTLPWE